MYEEKHFQEIVLSFQGIQLSLLLKICNHLTLLSPPEKVIIEKSLIRLQEELIQVFGPSLRGQQNGDEHEHE